MDELNVTGLIVATLAADLDLTALLGDGALGVYQAPAPPTASYPFVAIQHLTSTDLNGVGGDRLLTRGPWMVEVIDDTPGTLTVAAAVYAHVDRLLHQLAGSQGGTGVAGMVRETSFLRPETEGVQQFAHAGGMYRVTYY